MTRGGDSRSGEDLIQHGERGRFAMPIALRADYDAVRLRAIARRTKDAPQARRLLALAAIYDGATRTQAGRIGGVTLQIVRDWVVKFNGSGPDGLIDRKAPGQPSKLKEAHRAAGSSCARTGFRNGPFGVNPQSRRRLLASVRGRRVGRHLMWSEE